VLVNAAPSWITGQTYGITGALLTRSTSLLVAGSFEKTPKALARIVKEAGATIFIASAAFPKRAMPGGDQQAWFEAQKLPEQLRVAAACGETLAPAIHQLGMAALTKQYMNTYWGTEHGAVVLSHCYGNPDQPLSSNARMFPLPWTGAAVWVPEGSGPGPKRYHAAAADGSEKGILVCSRPCPSMARTVWGDAKNLLQPGWSGDIAAFEKEYFSSFVKDDGSPAYALSLGDLAQAWEDGSISVIGRHHELMNVAGSDVCVVDIENTLCKCDAVLDCLVVPLNDDEEGMVPVACLILRSTEVLTESLAARLKQMVHEEHGEFCVPTDFVLISAIPRTYNSKPMRQVVRQLFADSFHGDVSEISNPHCLMDLKSTIADWLAMRAAPVIDEYC